MRSPEATLSPDRGETPRDDERELKFALPQGRAPLVRSWLGRICRPDPEFPAALVSTIYYDTTALISLSEKLNSDYLKRKIRVRWYSSLQGDVTGPAFVEAKFRTGTRRSKVRQQLSFPAAEIAGMDLADRRLHRLPELLRAHGVLGHGAWQPLMLIRYRRDRYTEPASRARISLDSDIRAAAVNPAMIPTGDLSPLGTAVLEAKGRGDELPRALHGLLGFGIRKQSFSKFLAVYAHMTRRVF